MFWGKKALSFGNIYCLTCLSSHSEYPYCCLNLGCPLLRLVWSTSRWRKLVNISKRQSAVPSLLWLHWSLILFTPWLAQRRASNLNDFRPISGCRNLLLWNLLVLVKCILPSIRLVEKKLFPILFANISMKMRLFVQLIHEMHLVLAWLVKCCYCHEREKQEPACALQMKWNAIKPEFDEDRLSRLVLSFTVAHRGVLVWLELVDLLQYDIIPVAVPFASWKSSSLSNRLFCINIIWVEHVFVEVGVPIQRDQVFDL